MQPFESRGDVFDQPQVPVVATEHHVAVGGERFDVARREVQQSSVEGAAAQIVDQQGHVLFRLGARRQIAERLAEAERGGGRLVDDVEDFQPRHFTGVDGPLSSRLVEIGGHGDYRPVYRAKLANDVVLQLPQNAGLNDLGREPATVYFTRVVGQAHVALDPFGDHVRVDRRGRSGFLADDQFPVVKENDAGREQFPIGVADHLRPPPTRSPTPPPRR